MNPLQIVLDTNILVAALLSPFGASHRLLNLIGDDPRFEINVSVALALEYESILKRPGLIQHVDSSEADEVVDYLCLAANRSPIFFLWRPTLPDPGDDLVLELAVNCQADAIVTFNKRDFAPASRFDIKVMKPNEFLRWIGETP